jgi:hypothetical protein
MTTLIASIILAVVAGLITAEVWTWIPTWAEKLVKRAVKRVPEPLRARAEEEWYADLETWPTGIARLIFACSLMMSGVREPAFRRISLYAKLLWIICKLGWSVGRLLWAMPNTRIVLVGQVVMMILFGVWIRYRIPYFEWAFWSVGFANGMVSIWTTPAPTRTMRLGIGLQIAMYLSLILQRIYSASVFNWTFWCILVGITGYNIHMVRHAFHEVRD